DLRPDAASALDGTEDDCFSLPVVGLRVPAVLRSPVAVCLSRLPTHERLIGLYVARKRLRLLSHELVPNLVEHPPRGLVRHAKLTLQLLGRDPASSAGDEVHGVEPKLKRRGRALEDRSFQRVDAEAACSAVPRGPLVGSLVTLEDPFRFATRAVR